jgi:predicted dinucleotide-binding enzyme
MRIGVIGSGHIGGNCARQAVKAGHEVMVSFARNPANLEALAQAGDLTGKVVIDTTNQFGSGPKPEPGQTAAAFNAQRMPGARYVKSFNTLTAGFQEQAAGRNALDRVVQWVCGDDPAAKSLVAGLIEDMGYLPVDLGSTQTCGVMEAPRRPGALYGEEYRAADAQAVADAVRDSRPIPPTPTYA